jgi:hypothetical protein
MELSMNHESPSNDIGFRCPVCQSMEFSTWAFPHVLVTHWVLNPGLAVNELLLGQRIPKITFFCRSCGSNTTYVRYYRCPDCEQFHPEAIWTGSNGFGHWLGVICPDCGSEIPCLLNLVSWVILARLSPINWMLRKLVGRRYIAWEQRRACAMRERLEESESEYVVSSFPRGPESSAPSFMRRRESSLLLDGGDAEPCDDAEDSGLDPRRWQNEGRDRIAGFPPSRE